MIRIILRDGTDVRVEDAKEVDWMRVPAYRNAPTGIDEEWVVCKLGDQECAKFLANEVAGYVYEPEDLD